MVGAAVIVAVVMPDEYTAHGTVFEHGTEKPRVDQSTAFRFIPDAPAAPLLPHGAEFRNRLMHENSRCIAVMFPLGLCCRFPEPVQLAHRDMAVSADARVVRNIAGV